MYLIFQLVHHTPQSFAHTIGPLGVHIFRRQENRAILDARAQLVAVIEPRLHASPHQGALLERVVSLFRIYVFGVNGGVLFDALFSLIAFEQLGRNEGAHCEHFFKDRFLELFFVHIVGEMGT